MVKDKKILFAKSYNRMNYGIVPPISAGYLAASLAQNGWQSIKIMDCVLEQITPEQFEEELHKNTPDILGMTVFSNNTPVVKAHLEAAKRANPNIINIIGGPHPSAVPAEELFDFFGDTVDYAFRGEGDKGLPMLLDKVFYDKEVTYEEIPGLIWKENGMLRSNPAYLEENLDILPMPRWDLMPPDKYPQATMGSFFKNFPIAFLVTSRGCPFQCDFCNVTALLGHKVRTKSAEQIIAELDSLYALGWRDGIFFVDDNFIGNKRQLKGEILPALIEWRKGKTGFAFNTEASINLADDEELMQMMVKAGFNSVFVGIETPNQESLTECGKKQNTNRDLLENVRHINRTGLQVQGGFIVGFDSDTPSVFQQQIDFIQQSGIVTAMVGLLQAPHGTRLYERLKGEGRLLPHISGNNVDGSTNIVP